MANNQIQIKRTSVSGRTPNTTSSSNGQYIAPGELALNLADGILYSSNGSALIPVGANNVDVNVSGNLTVNSIIANGVLGTAGKILASNSTGGIYWTTAGGTGTVTQINSGNGLSGGPITTSGTLSVLANTGIVANSTGVFVDPTYIETQTANNTSFVGTISAANVVSNAQLSANIQYFVNTSQLSSNLNNYQTTAGLSANVATLTSNNTSFVGSVSAANVVSNNQLSSNLSNYAQLAGATFTGQVNVSNTLTVNGLTTFNSNVTVDASGSATLVVGNSTINTTINTTSMVISNSVANATINTTSFYISNSISNVTITPSGITIAANGLSYVTMGNSVVNTVVNATALYIANTSTNTTLNPGVLTLGTATINSTFYQGQANDVYYVNGVTAVNVVSNGQLQSNLANYTNTSSLYLTTLNDVSASGPTSGQVLTYSTAVNKWIPQVVPSITSNTTPGYYGSFFDNSANQTIISTSNAYIVRIANTYEQNGVTVNNNTDITFTYSGTYEIIYSIQLSSSSNQPADINVWMKKNGNTNVDNSDSKFTVFGKGGSDANIIVTAPFIATVNSGDFFRLAWSATDTSVKIITVPASAIAPVIPGVIVTAKQISNIIAKPPGSNTQVLFNDSNITNAVAGFTFDKTSNNLYVGNNLYVTASVNAAQLDVDGYFIANTSYVYVNNGIYFTPKAGVSPNTSEGSVFYDSTNHALNFYTDTASPQEINQQFFARVYNNTGSTLSKGAVVYINGTNANRPTVAKAIANSATMSRAIGFVYDDILTASEGFVLTRGILQTFDTRNFAPNQEIWLSATTAGAISNAQPSYPNYQVSLGFALNSALSGTVYGSVPTQTFTTPNTSIGISNGTVYVSSNNLTFDYANNVLLIGNSTTNTVIGYQDRAGTTTYFEMSGNVGASIDMAIINYGSTANGSSDFAAYDSNGPSSSNFIDMGINSNAYNQSYWTINGPSDGYLYTGNTNLSIGTATAKYINFFTGDTLAANERMRITPTGNVGINNTNPLHTLSINGTLYVNGLANVANLNTNVANATNVNATNISGTLTTASQPNITANNTSFVGTVSAANVVSNSQLSGNLSNYQTTAGLSANVATLTSNNTSFVGSVSAANVVSNSQLSGNLANYVTTTNLTNNLANYQTTAGLSANVATLTANNTSFVGSVSAANVVSNSQLSGNLANYVTATNFTNNLANYQTTAGLSANVATLTSNNSYNLNGVNNYVTNTGNFTLSGNITFSANLTANIILQTPVQRDAFTNTTSGTGGQIVDFWSLSSYRSVKYTLSVKDNNANAFQLSELLVLNDSTNPQITEYGIIQSNGTLGTFSANSNTSAIRLVFTPSSGNTTIKADRLLISS